MNFLLSNLRKKRYRLLQSQVGYVNFTWKSGSRKYMYHFDRLESFDERILKPPVVSVDREGRVPKKPKSTIPRFQNFISLLLTCEVIFNNGRPLLPPQCSACFSRALATRPEWQASASVSTYTRGKESPCPAHRWGCGFARSAQRSVQPCQMINHPFIIFLQMIRNDTWYSNKIKLKNSTNLPKKIDHISTLILSRNWRKIWTDLDLTSVQYLD